MSGESQPQPDINTEVGKKAHELLVEHLAHAEALKNPDFRRAMIDRKAVEAEAENIGRLKAVELARQHEHEAVNYDEHPWGIDYLKRSRSLGTILRNVRKAADEKKEFDPSYAGMEAARAEALEKAIREARSLTLESGKVVAERLSSRQISPDIKVILEHSDEEKKFSAEGLRRKGKVRSKLPVISHEDMEKGWELPISGQINQAAKVVLCEDGRILVAYGKYQEDQGSGESRLYVKPNAELHTEEHTDILPLINRPAPEIKPKSTYYSYLNEQPESDIGLANLPIDTSVARAHIILNREESMQEAVASLLVKHSIPLD